MNRLGQVLRSSGLVVALAACGREPPTPAVAAEPRPPEAPVLADAIDASEGSPLQAEPPPWPLPDEILTPWEFALIVMDPHHLTAAQRRQRAFSRRKAMMLNPDSVTARVLEDLAKAAEEGHIDAGGSSQVVFTARGAEGKAGGPPPAGWRPPDASAEGSAPGADASAPGADGSR